MTLLKLIVLSTLSIPFSSHAGTIESSAQNIFEMPYHVTYEICKPHAFPIQPKMYKPFWDGLRNGLWPKDGKPFAFSVQMQTLIKSEGYWDALEDCYGLDEWKWMQFTTRLIVAERSGRIVGNLTPLGFFRWLGRTAWVLRYPQVTLWAGRLATTSIGASIAIMVIQKILVHRKIKEMERNPQTITDGFDKRADELYEVTLQVLGDEKLSMEAELKGVKIGTPQYEDLLAKLGENHKATREIRQLWNARRRGNIGEQKISAQ